jgi:Spy/CpxP family protein refolding chaperone
MHPSARRLATFAAVGSLVTGLTVAAAAQTPEAAPAKPAPKRAQRGGKGLNLSPQELAKVMKIFGQVQEEYNRDLTPAGRKKLESLLHGLGGGKHARRKPGMMPRLARLNLNNDQQAKVDAARADFRREQQDIRSRNLPEKQRKAAIRQARMRLRTSIEGVLTPEQRERMKTGPGKGGKQQRPGDA